MNDEDDKDAKFPRAEDDFVMKLNLGTQERELPVTEIKSRIIRAIAEASPEIVAVQNGPSTYIKSTYIKSTYIKSTYIKATYIKAGSVPP